MTRKDYTKLAHALRVGYSTNGDNGRWNGSKETTLYLSIVESIAQMLATDNERFDKARFVEACLKDVTLHSGFTKGN